MRIHDVIRERLRVTCPGLSVASDVNAVIAANIDESTTDAAPPDKRRRRDGGAHDHAQSPSKPSRTDRREF